VRGYLRRIGEADIREKSYKMLGRGRGATRWEVKGTEVRQGRNPGLDGQQDADAKVVAVLHELAVEHDLVGAEPVALGVGRVGGLGDLHLAPLPVGRDGHALLHDRVELLVDALLLDAALALDQRRLGRRRHAEVADGRVEEDKREPLLVELVSRRLEDAVPGRLEVAARDDLERL